MQIPRTDFPELVFGFVAPIGANLQRAISAFRRYFERQSYRVVEIKVTDEYRILRRVLAPEKPLVEAPPQERYSSYIAYGDQLRAKFEDDSFLAATAISQIAHARQRLGSSSSFEKTVYLLHQFKRKEEVELLRSVYGDSFFQISVYSRRGVRVENLARKFAEGDNSSNINEYRSQAENLVQTDENESKNDHGQQVAKIFHTADFIINLDEYSPSSEDQITRFCELIFSSNRISPTKMEHGMYLAQGAALRSLDLSRQVGACILDANGQILCLGANEVPKATGGTYWANEKFDDRDFLHGEDSNELRKREILSEIASHLGHDIDVEAPLENHSIKDSRLMDALEYGRIIHAEMNAICDAARLGRSCAGGILYCTTFPCHMCAKLIIAAGISKVVFLEPYPKSLARQLHSDALQIEGDDRGTYNDFPSVQFIHFFGATPRRYRELFERGRRKDSTGKFQGYKNGIQRPLISIKTPSYPQAEGYVLQTLKLQFTRLKLDPSILSPPSP